MIQMLLDAVARRIVRYLFDQGHARFYALPSEESRQRHINALYHAFNDPLRVLSLIASARDLLGDRATEQDRDFLARLGEVADAHRGAPN